MNYEVAVSTFGVQRSRQCGKAEGQNGGRGQLASSALAEAEESGIMKRCSVVRRYGVQCARRLEKREAAV